MKVTNELNDYGWYMRSKGSIYQVLDQKNAAIVSLIMGLIAFMFGVGAFIARVFLRRKLGSRSFGLVTITCSYLWIKWVESVHKSNLTSGKSIDFSTLIDYILKPVLDFMETIFGTTSFKNTMLYPLSKYTNINDLLHWFSLAILLFAFGHYLGAVIRDFRKEKWHSYHRGESLLFKWLVGKRVFNTVISDTTVWMFIEPIFVFSIALPFSSTPDGAGLAFVLKTSAVCLFLQEYMVYQKKRATILDIIDTELESEEIFDEINQHKRLQNLSNIPQKAMQTEVIL